MSNSPRHESNAQLVKAVLQAAARLSVAHSIQYQTLSEALQKAFVEEAAKALEARGEHPNISRLSVMTGLTRRKVMSLHHGEEHKESRVGLVQRVILRWRSEDKFLNPGGTPRILSCDFDDSDFAKLVSKESKDVHPGSVLFELERIGAVVRTRNGVRLQVRAYVPKGDSEEGMRLLSEDVFDLARSVGENVFAPSEPLNLHGKTEYRQIPRAAVSEIKEWLIREGSAFHEKMRNFMRKLGAGSASKGTGIATSETIRVAVGSFSIVEKSSDNGEKS